MPLFATDLECDTFVATLLQEKAVDPDHQWCLDVDGVIHLVDLGFLLALIRTQALDTKRLICLRLLHLDLTHQPVLPYLETLALRYARHYQATYRLPLMQPPD